MRTIASCILILLFLLAIAGPVLALTGPVKYQGKTYYVVNANDPTEDTGKEVCEKAGKAYVGFTARTTDVCTLVHPSAKVTSGVDGSSTGFYCNGAPQGGICAKQTDTCNICPACNLNVDASTVIGDQYREMYVECQESVLNDLHPAPTPPEFTPTFFTSVYSGIRLSVLSMYWNIADKQVLSRYLGGKWGCDFYQYPLANQKSVDCTKSGDANAYCQNRLGSASAGAEYCGADGAGEGLIVCSESCTAGSAPATCPADSSRTTVRGTSAPVSSCTGTTTGVSDTGAVAPAGAVTRTTGPVVTINRPTLQAGTTKTVEVTGSTPVKKVTVTGTGLDNLIVHGDPVQALPKGMEQPDGMVYQYFELVPERYTTITSVKYEFDIPSSWISEQKSGSSAVSLYRYSSNAWGVLPTTVEREENGRVYYSATGSGFSYFAIGIPYAQQAKLGTGQNVCPRSCIQSTRDSTSTNNCLVSSAYVGKPGFGSCAGFIDPPVNANPTQCSCYPVETQVSMGCPSSCSSSSSTCVIASPGKTGIACEGIVQQTTNIPCLCVVRSGTWHYAVQNPVLNVAP
jgi:PGF-pre-PGF domain-containing protein